MLQSENNRKQRNGTSVVPVVLKIARDYSRYPGPRFAEDGPNSGEEFRERLLVPALEKAEREGEKVIVDLDGARGYTASFLEEAFGGLIRKGFTRERLARVLEIQAKDKRVIYWRDRIKQYLEHAEAAERY